MKTRCWLLVLVLTLVLAAPAGAATPKSGVYKGKTSQKLSITIKVSKAKTITVFRVFVKNSCGATNREIDASSPQSKVKVKKSGRFSATLASGSDTLTFNGRFGRKGKVTGKVREQINDPLFGKCDTGKVTFSAKRK